MVMFGEEIIEGYRLSTVEQHTLKKCFVKKEEITKLVRLFSNIIYLHSYVHKRFAKYYETYVMSEKYWCSSVAVY